MWPSPREAIVQHLGDLVQREAQVFERQDAVGTRELADRVVPVAVGEEPPGWRREAATVIAEALRRFGHNRRQSA